MVCEDVQINIRSIAKKWGPTKDRANMKLKAKKSNTALFQVCKMISVEYQPIYLAATFFKFSGPIACATWVKRYVPVKLLGKVKHLRISDPGPYSEIVRMRKGHSRYSDTATCASSIKYSASAVLGVLELEMDKETLSKLSPGALQIEVVNKDCEIFWASDPEHCDIPGGEILRTKWRGGANRLARNAFC